MRQKHDDGPEAPRYYLYKITVDEGGAPCVQDGTLSLAICKPQIRRTARTGDFILGFAANFLAPSYPDNCLVYVAKVTNAIDGKEYFSQGEYGSRRDSIYRWRNGRFSPRDNDFHGAECLEHDLGKFPVYEKARVLVGKGAANFRYFGNTNPIDYRLDYSRLSRIVDNLAQGHRVARDSELRTEIEDLIRECWKHRSVPQQVRTSNIHQSCHPHSTALRKAAKAGCTS